MNQTQFLEICDADPQDLRFITRRTGDFVQCVAIKGENITIRDPKAKHDIEVHYKNLDVADCPHFRRDKFGRKLDTGNWVAFVNGQALNVGRIRAFSHDYQYGGKTVVHIHVPNRKTINKKAVSSVVLLPLDDKDLTMLIMTDFKKGGLTGFAPSTELAQR